MPTFLMYQSTQTMHIKLYTTAMQWLPQKNVYSDVIRTQVFYSRGGCYVHCATLPAMAVLVIRHDVALDSLHLI
jgi:hypothetical protein